MSNSPKRKSLKRNGSVPGLDSTLPFKLRAGGNVAQIDSDFPALLLRDYLNQDHRPTFIAELITKFDFQSPPDVRLVFSNKSLLAFENLYEEIVDTFSYSLSLQDVDDDDSREFRSWVAGVMTRPRSSKSGQTQVFHDMLWTATIMDNRWVVVSGLDISNADSTSSNYIEQSKKGAIEMDVSDLSDANSAHEVTLNLKAKVPHQDSEADIDGIWPPPILPESEHLNFIRQFDWASTPLGPMKKWPPQLRQAVETILSDPDPATIFWGDELIMIYNEPYIAIIGDKHPALMGESSRVHFPEVWDQYEPLFQQMRLNGRAFKQEDQQLFLQRRGYLEEGFFNLTVMPILGEDGTVQGFYEPVSDVTRQTLSQRRLHTLLRLSEISKGALSPKDIWKLLLNALKDDKDTNFAILYSLEQKQDTNISPENFSFEGAIGLQDDAAPFQDLLQAGAGDGKDASLIEVFRSAYQQAKLISLDRSDRSASEDLLGALEKCGMSTSCRELVISPLLSSVDEGNIAFILLGISPNRQYDEDFQIFAQLLKGQVETTITSVRLFEKEKQLLVEQATYESEHKLKKFAEHAPIGIFIADSEGNIKYCNEAWLGLSGHPRDDMSAGSWVHDIHPDNLEEVLAQWNKLSQVAGSETFEVQYKKPWRPLQGGDDMSFLDRTWVVCSVYPVFSASGEWDGLTGCTTNISDQKWAEYLQSQRLSEALELKRQQENFLDITSHEMRNPLNAILHSASELIELLTEQTVNLHPFDQLASVLGECLDASRTIAYCGRHQKRIIDDVLTLSKLDSDLLSITPLTTKPHEIVDEVLRVFDAELRAANIQTETVLSDSYHNLQIESVLMDPHRVIQILINLVANAIKFTKNEALRSLRVVISAFLSEPTSNLNDVKYVPSGRKRKIPDPTKGAEWGSGEVVFIHFSVQDTGPGMTKEEANLLFNRFVQGRPRTHSQYGGSGLGLFISRELSELHGGRIGISSKLGFGSTFEFYVKGRRALEDSSGKSSPSRTGSVLDQKLPASRKFFDSIPPQMRAAKSSPSVLQVGSSFEKLHVLIVEDNLINQKILAKIMRKEGFNVSIANHGEEALAIIQKSKWAQGQEQSETKLDIVLADIEMPVMDGKACVRKIREWQREGLLHGNIPVIAVTGNVRMEQVEAAKESGYDDVISKPYQTEDIIRRIYHFTKRRKLSSATGLMNTRHSQEQIL